MNAVIDKSKSHCIMRGEQKRRSSACMDNSEINSRIADLLGYKAIKLSEPNRLWVDPPGVALYVDTYIANEKGEDISGVWQTEDLAWEHCDIPSWASDLNEVVKLVTDDFNLHYSATVGWSARFGTTQVVSETPARAICEAWIKEKVKI